MIKNKGTLVIISFVLALFILPTAAFAQSSPQEGGTIVTVGQIAEPGTLDPHKTGEADANTIFARIGLTLVDVNPETKDYEGVLAKDWNTSEDELTWEFHLKEGVKFHDGTDLTAQDFVKTFDRAKELGNMAASLLENVEEIKAKDKYTLVLELSETTGLLLHNLSQAWLMPISFEALEEMGEDEFGRKPVSVGPWKVDEWQSGQQITFSSFEEYNWAPKWFDNEGPPYPNKLVRKFISEESTMLSAIQAGEVNLATQLPAQFMGDLRDNDEFSVERILRRGLGLYVTFNFENEILRNLKVRKAFNHAINKEGVLQIAMEGRGVPSYGPLPPSIWGYDEKVKEYGYHYNLEKAKELLNEAGWTDSDNDGIRDKNGEPLELDLYTYTRTEWRRAATVLQSQFEEIGASINIQTYEWGTYTEALSNKEHDLCLMGYHYEDPDVLYLFLHTSQMGSGLNFGFLEDSKLDSMLEKGRSVPTQSKRLEVYHDIQKYVVDNAIWAPILTEYEYTAIHENIKGVSLHPTRAHAVALLQDAWVEQK